MSEPVPAENVVMRTETHLDHNGDPLDVTFYLLGSENPFSASEFEAGTPTRKMLDKIEELILYGSLEEE